jgi:hypothetical protein
MQREMINAKSHSPPTKLNQMMNVENNVEPLKEEDEE